MAVEDTTRPLCAKPVDGFGTSGAKPEAARVVPVHPHFRPQGWAAKYAPQDHDFIEVINVCNACNIKPEDFVSKFVNTFASKE